MYVAGQERTRSLTDKGVADAHKVGMILHNEIIDCYVSSPYKRAIQTIENAAGDYEIELFEDLREREIGRIPDNKFKESKLQVYEDFEFSFPEGESSNDAQHRAITVLLDLLQAYEGKKIVLGTHGDIMTLMLNYFDKTYHYDFWESTTIPDVYKLDFHKMDLIRVTRKWAD
jgi:2,3-bisphosphoglycerate-dependent phosphoglycerate mutase